MSDIFFPLASIGGRQPLISHEFEPGTHLGVDLGFKALDTDDHEKHNRTGHWYQPLNSTWVAMLDGVVLYSEKRSRGWAVRIRTTHNLDILYMHGVPGTCSITPHQLVLAGKELAAVGYDPTDPEGWRHLHFETRVPARKSQRADGWGCVPVDPAGFLKGLHAKEKL